jgi:SAM-dependent methyltransferase
MIRFVESRLLSDYLVKTEGPFLDLGCGDGTFRTSLDLRDVYGIDIDEQAIKNLRKDGYYREAHHASASKIPFPDGFFPTVFSNCAIEHMDRLDIVLLEVRRILKEKGNFIFTIPTKRLFEVIMKDPILIKNGFVDPDTLNAYNRFQHHVNIFDLEAWNEKLEHAGFRVVNHKYYLPRWLGRFVARMDMLYGIGGPDAKNLIDKLERRYRSSAGLPLRIYFYHYLRGLRGTNSGTHLMIVAEKA